MTNTIAIGLFLAIAGLLALDHFVLGWQIGLTMARHGVDLIQYLAFWR